MRRNRDCEFEEKILFFCLSKRKPATKSLENGISATKKADNFNFFALREPKGKFSSHSFKTSLPK